MVKQLEFSTPVMQGHIDQRLLHWTNRSIRYWPLINNSLPSYALIDPLALQRTYTFRCFQANTDVGGERLVRSLDGLEIEKVICLNSIRASYHTQSTLNHINSGARLCLRYTIFFFSCWAFPFLVLLAIGGGLLSLRFKKIVALVVGGTVL